MIDVAPFIRPQDYDDEARAAVVQLLRQTSEDSGFFQMVGHGIPQSLMDTMISMARDFFALPQDEKNALSVKTAPAPHSNRGYGILGDQTLEKGTKPDLKESFLLGNHIPLDDERVLAGRMSQGPNQYPAESSVPGFRNAVDTYHALMLALGDNIMPILALALGLPSTYFSEFTSDSFGVLRLLHYPPHPADAPKNQRGCGAHTDFGAVTLLLLQEGQGGLQVQDKNDPDVWIDIPAMRGAFVVNLGDAIDRWTAGRFHSNVHRVLNYASTDRYSVPFFYEGNMTHVMQPIKELGPPPQGRQAPEPVSMEQHLRNRYEESYRANFAEK